MYNYVENRGFTKTLVHNDYGEKINEINWSANYDGDIANVAVKTNNNGKKQKYLFQLDNDDLEDILNVPSIDMPLEKRLLIDFQKPNSPKYISLADRHISSPQPGQKLVRKKTSKSKSHKKTYRKTNRKKRSHTSKRNSYPVLELI
jgi:hypothetical protein